MIQIKKNFIQERRLREGLSQQQVADLLKCHRTTVARWEALDGTVFQPHHSKWVDLAYILRTKPEKLYEI